MGNDDHGHTVSGQLFNELQHFAHHLRIQRAGGFVKQHHIRIHHQGADNGNPLPLASGEHIGVGVRLVQQADPGQQSAALLLRLCLGFHFQLHRGQCNVLHDGQVGEQVEVLKHHANPPPGHIHIGVGIRQILPFKNYFASGGLLQQIQAPQEGALAAAGGADHHYPFAFFDGCGNALEDVQLAEALC